MDLHTGCGLEPWRRVHGLELTRWDLWFLLVLVQECGGSWDRLATRLRDPKERKYPSFFDRQDWEAKRSHMEHLRDALESSHLDPVKLLGRLVDARPALVLYKAREKLFKTEVSRAYKTAAMVDTPRHRLEAGAMRGAWSEFPVDPGPFEPVFTNEVRRRDHYGELATFGLVRRLEDRLKRARRDAGEDKGRRLALYRAGLTALLEGVAGVDDSCGAFGDFYQEVLKGYFEVPWTMTGLAPETYYRDFLNLATWEDYGFMHGQLGPFFHAIRPEHIPTAKAALGSIREELARHEELVYQAKKARELLGELEVETQVTDRRPSAGRGRPGQRAQSTGTRSSSPPRVTLRAR